MQRVKTQKVEKKTQKEKSSAKEPKPKIVRKRNQSLRELKIRIPIQYMEKIEEIISKRPGHITKNTLINEILAEKLHL
jgi:hypothetical protein